MKLNLAEKVILTDQKILSFLNYRFNLKNGPDGYRGNAVSEQNRWKFEKFELLIELISKYGENGIEISSKKSDFTQNKPYLNEFKKFCKIFFEKYGEGTELTIKKNMLPDLSKMGAINRFDGKGILIESNFGNKKTVRNFKISNLGIEFVNLKNYDERIMKYDQFCRNILKPILSDLYFCIEKLDYYITIEEFALFFTFIGKKYNEITYTLDMALENILSFRNLERHTVDSIIKELKSFMDPNNYKNLPKDEKRDFYNLMNSVQQTFSLFEGVNDLKVEKAGKKYLSVSLVKNLD